ncbi:tetratricopeptide repeat protein [Solwaraspora sp. WMMA2101]|uniref:tetratricopeptide repeat protein n=1 Tax=Solwaraspora sp. WMMA2101 TaxID=3404124 RepID=UPI003B94961E
MTGPDATTGQTDPFVDRETALAAFDQFTAGAPERVLVYSGMSGQGKSRLLVELGRRLASGRTGTVDLDRLVETAPGGHADVAFATTDAVARICAGWTGARLRRYQQARRAAEAALAAAYAEVPTVTVSATDGAVVQDVSITVVTDPAALRAAGVRAHQRTLIAEALADELRGADLTGRVLFVDTVERLPYLDEVAGPDDEARGARQTSWFLGELLPRLLDAAPDLRIVLAGREPPAAGPPMLHVALTEWEPVHTAQFLATRGITDPALVEAVHRTCAGLPGWTDLAAAAIDTARGSGPGLTADEIARRAAGQPVERWLPEVFLDRLAAPWHAVVTAAAVPRVLSRAAVAALLDPAPADDTWFHQLGRYTFVRLGTDTDGSTVATLHPLVRIALLDSLRRNDPGRLRELHLRARAYFAGLGEATEELYHALALGSGLAGTFWRQRFDQAIATLQTATARTLIDLVLAPEQRAGLLVADPRLAVDAEVGAAVVSRLTNRHDDAQRHLAQAQHLAGRSGYRAALSTIAQERARLALWGSQVADGIDEARIALSIATDLGRDGDQGQAHDLLGDLSMRSGDLATARQHFAAAIAAFEQSGSPEGKANSLLSLGNLELRDGDPVAARRSLDTALTLYVAAGRRRGQADVHLSLGLLDRMSEDPTNARTHYLTAERLYLAVDDEMGAANCRYRLGELAVDAGDLAQAEQYFTHAEQVFTAHGDRLGVANTQRGLGGSALHRKDYGLAQQRLRRAAEIYDEIDSAYGRAMVNYLLGEVAVGVGDLLDAGRLLAISLATVEQVGDVSLRGQIQLRLGLVAVVTGDPTRGAELIRQALADFRQAGLPGAAASAEQALAKIDQDRGQVLARLDALAPAPRLLLDLISLVAADDRWSFVVEAVWPVLWQAVHPSSGAAVPDFAAALAALTRAGLVTTQRTITPDAGPVTRYGFPDDAVRVMVRDAAEADRTRTVNELLAVAWFQRFEAERATPTPTTVRAGVGAAVYTAELGDLDTAWQVMEATLQVAQVTDQVAAMLPMLREIAMRSGDRQRFAQYLLATSDDTGELTGLLDQARADGHDELATAIAAGIHDRLLAEHQPARALDLADQELRTATGEQRARWLRRRLAALYDLGRHRDILAGLDDALTAAAEAGADLDTRAAADRDELARLQVAMLHHGVGAAKATAEWELALSLNDRILHQLAAIGASPAERAYYRFSGYAALLELGLWQDCERVLADSERAFRAADDTTMVAAVLSARAILASRRGEPFLALEFDREALATAYAVGDLGTVSQVHANYANHLAQAGGAPAERVAHRLASALLYRLVGNAPMVERTLAGLAAEPRRTGLRSTLPRSLAELAQRVAVVPGVDLVGMLSALGADAVAVNDAFDRLMVAAR